MTRIARRWFPLAVALATATLMSSIDVRQARAGSVCKSQYMFGSSAATSQSTAKQRARVNWRSKVTLSYGAQYRDWDHANNRQYGCDKKSWRWHCTAYGYPCLYS